MDILLNKFVKKYCGQIDFSCNNCGGGLAITGSLG